MDLSFFEKRLVFGAFDRTKSQAKDTVKAKVQPKTVVDGRVLNYGNGAPPTHPQTPAAPTRQAKETGKNLASKAKNQTGKLNQNPGRRLAMAQPVPQQPPVIESAQRRLNPRKRLRSLSENIVPPKIKKAVETALKNPEKAAKIFDFINTVMEQGYSGNHKEWNKAFCEKVLNVKTGNNHRLARQYAKALQIFLNKAHTHTNGKTADVFGPKGGRFARFDGLIGPYTLNAMRMWLIKEHGSNKKIQTALASKLNGSDIRQKLKHGDLSAEWKKKGIAKEFKKSMSYFATKFPETATKWKVVEGSGKRLNSGRSGINQTGQNPDSKENMQTALQVQEATLNVADSVTAAGKQHIARLNENKYEQWDAFKTMMQSGGIPYSEYFFAWKGRRFTRHNGANPIFSRFSRMSNSWVRKAYDEYVKGYKTDKTKLSAKLKTAIEKYHLYATKMIQRLNRAYQNEVENYIRRHDLPTHVSLAKLEGYYKNNLVLLAEQGKTNIQRDKIKYEKFRQKTGYEAFFTKFFGDKENWPTNTFKKGTVDDKWQAILTKIGGKNPGTQLQDEFPSLSKVQIIEEINNIILLRNMAIVFPHLRNIKARYQLELKRNFRKLNNAYSTYFLYRGQKKSGDFLREYVTG